MGRWRGCILKLENIRYDDGTYVSERRECIPSLGNCETDE